MLGAELPAPLPRDSDGPWVQLLPAVPGALGSLFPVHFCKQLGSSLARPWGPAPGWLDEMLTQVGKVGRGGFLEEVALDAGGCGL